MLKVKGVHKVYRVAGSSLAVLRGIDLDIEEGGFIALVGPSGAGKSTLLHIASGLDTPTEGEVVLGGFDLARLNDSALSRLRNERLGFVFQFYHLLSEFTLLENVMLPALVNSGRGSDRRAIRDKAWKLIDEVGLSARAGHFPAQLSGGEQQRVAIARALVNGPKVLFCDEPTGNLDTETGKGIISLIRNLNEKERMTVVMVTHNEELAKTAGRQYHLRDGVLVN
jgi:lipoprotein-releasing system ATP-binding protein